MANKLIKARPPRETHGAIELQDMLPSRHRRQAFALVRLPGADGLARRPTDRRYAGHSAPRSGRPPSPEVDSTTVATLVTSQARLLTFHPDETDAGIAVHKRAADEPVSLAQADMAQAMFERKRGERDELLRTGGAAPIGQALKAIGGEGLGLAMVASTGFNFHNVMAQLLISQAVRARLPPHLTPPQREAICATASLVGAPFAAGVGALIAQILWSPLAVGAYHELVGAHVFEPQDLELLFPPSRAYVDQRAKVTVSRPLFDRANERTASQRATAAARHAADGTDGMKVYVLVTLGFAIFHALRVAYAPLEQNPLIEALQAAGAAFLGAGVGMAVVAAMKWLATIEVPDTRDGQPPDATRRVRLYKLATLAPLEGHRSMVSSRLIRNFSTFTDDRRGSELARFLGVRALRLSGIVHVASLPTPLLQAGAAHASDGAAETPRRFVKGATVVGTYVEALLIILNRFTKETASGTRPKPLLDEEALIGLPDVAHAL